MCFSDFSQYTIKCPITSNIKKFKTQKSSHKKLIFPSDFHISVYAFTINQDNQAQNKIITIFDSIQPMGQILTIYNNKLINQSPKNKFINESSRSVLYSCPTYDFHKGILRLSTVAQGKAYWKARHRGLRERSNSRNAYLRSNEIFCVPTFSRLNSAYLKEAF